MRFLACWIIFFVSGAGLWAQQGFDEKRKQASDINTTELHAKPRKFEQNNTAKQSLGKQPADFQELKAQASSSEEGTLFEIVGNRANGRPAFIRVKQATPPANQKAFQQSPQEKAQKVLQQLKPLVWLGANHSFQQKAIKPSKNGNVKVLWEQTYQQVPVYGTEVITHLEGQQVTSINGIWAVVEEVSGAVNINQAEALALAIAWLRSHATYEPLTDAQLEKYDIHAPHVRLVVYKAHEGYRYAYEIELRATLLQEWTMILEASNGAVLEAYDHVCDVDGPVVTNSVDLLGVSREITTYLSGTDYVMEDVSKGMFNSTDSTGIIYTLDAQGSTGATLEDIISTDNTWSPTATSAHYNASVSYNYYEQWHGRNSIDGEGGDIYSVINITDGAGNEVDNAYWSNPFMVYGNGNTVFEPLAKSLDVAGHEMTHGVIEAEANLAYQGESGAINESFADVFGCLIDSANWTLGEDIMKSPNYTTGVLRDLEDPNNGGTQFGDLGWQPKHVDEQYIGSFDNGGVHINSGIPNHAFYLIATAIGRKDAGDIYYRALTNYLTRFAQFVDLRIAVVQSTIDLFGENSAEQIVVENAFDAVGILAGEGTNVNNTLTVNPGDEQLLFVDQDNTTDTTMYQSDFNVLNPLTQTPVGNRPAVTDDGTLMAFIGEDNKLYLIDITDPTNPVQTEYFSEPIYSSVALSKDGSRIALTTVDQDTAIYVHHFERNETMKFELYNPTYSEGVKSGGVLYADALEWDYTGENIIYDAFNEVVNQNDENIEFWDVGMIEVWDNSIDDFGTGEIEKIFTGLDKGESIGNPVLSKNSPYIMALDYSYETSSSFSFSILGYNIQTNELGFIFNNNYISWPSYARQDDFLFFSYVQQVVGEDLIFGTAAIPLSTNKISAAGNATVVVNEAKYGMIYALGNRDIILSTDETFVDQPQLRVYPNPVNHTLYIEGLTAAAEITLSDVTGKVTKSYTTESSLTALDVKGLSAGLYILSVRAKNTQQSFKIIIE